MLGAGDFGCPYVLPGGTPADRRKILRDAFEKTMNDPAVAADAEKKKLEIDLSTGDELEALAKDVTTQPRQIVARMQKILGK